MATREEMSPKIRQDLAARGVTPADPSYEFVLLALEDTNNGGADLDDELADIAGRLAWLALVLTWTNRREFDQFEAFVNAKFAECEASLAAVRTRWGKHQAEKPIAPSAGQKP